MAEVYIVKLKSPSRRALFEETIGSEECEKSFVRILWTEDVQI
jgi:hypothetical protein